MYYLLNHENIIFLCFSLCVLIKNVARHVFLWKCLKSEFSIDFFSKKKCLAHQNFYRYTNITSYQYTFKSVDNNFFILSSVHKFYDKFRFDNEGI